MVATRVLVTGGTGFVGTAFLRRSIGEGLRVAAFVRPGSMPAWDRSVSEAVRVIPATLEMLDDARVREQIASFNPDTLVHLAWSGVKGADRNSIRQFENVRYGLKLMAIAEQSQIRHVIGLGSQAEYGPCARRIPTSQATNPTTLYGAAKLSTYHALRCLAVIGKIECTWMRLFSSYGPGDDPSWMIQYLIRALLKGERPKLTLCEQRWDYIFVDDVADAIVSVIKARASGLFNLGAGVAYRLRDLVEMIRDNIDPDLELGFGEVPYRSDQVMHLEADIDDLHRMTGWTPRVTIENGLRRTIEHARTALAAELG